jgi:hypothetical protein
LEADDVVEGVEGRGEDLVAVRKTYRRSMKRIDVRRNMSLSLKTATKRCYVRSRGETENRRDTSLLPWLFRR